MKILGLLAVTSVPRRAALAEGGLFRGPAIQAHYNRALRLSAHSRPFPLHLHILGIGGTFMGGLAQIAQAAGHRVSGCDANVYPPMSDQLSAAGIACVEGFGADQIALAPDMFVIGNVVTRGNPLMEAILQRGLPFVSGPQWIAQHILRGRHVLAVAGTHGKTTSSSMLAWILEYARLEPGFLIGGVPLDFDRSARLTRSRYFVIEADEYDTAFFDKRSKFVHYLPNTAVLNNLEYDHADIFANLEAIETQFHHLLRTVPSNGKVISRARDEALERVLARGVWSNLERFGQGSEWDVDDAAPFAVRHRSEKVGELRLASPGAHNRANALGAIAAAHHAGVTPQIALDALAEFKGVKRRLELRGTVDGVAVIDDFAHHPSAIRATIAALRSAAAERRIIAIVEPRSNTMKLGSVRAQLAPSLAQADQVYCYAGPGVTWDVAQELASLGERAHSYRDLELLIEEVLRAARTGDRLLVMSNGGFGGIHGRLLQGLAAKGGA